ncbi:hypothetical protein K1417_RS07135 [Escherichia coli]|nr:hypothetical protein [Escherichia coli]MCW3278581.1 hypothetical protein [Escherichia coli]
MLPMWWLPGTAGTTTGVAVIPPLVLCDMVSARYAALCARSGALT